jgi:hypothetical protein
VGSLFSVKTVPFVHKLFNFTWSHLSILSLSCWALWVLLRKSLSIPIPRYSLLFPALASKFQVLY